MASLDQVIRDLMLSGMLMVTAAGFYAMFYALGRLLRSPGLVRFSYLFALLQALGALGMILPNYLDPFWKYLIAFSSIVYLFVPQGMWWVVTTFHEREHVR